MMKIYQNKKKKHPATQTDGMLINHREKFSGFLKLDIVMHGHRLEEKTFFGLPASYIIFPLNHH